ncbi:oligosaccharide flippase family protein [Temperatibacter marinus]|uniref:Oligosaccharide flippase family protein n=1 Tax=Temperatibacter marinus TaxID=1456591 RepID=A0AA52ECM3_9PROT|nr:oligosaccharide flippase family protein [Temperatibacter marinus]WND02311.1 oligosaccharide flippase family protein [Temperatibacter marinus]
MTDKTPSLGKQVMKGAGIMVLGRWLIRLLGIVSVSVTARLLTPEDFGIMGAAALVIGLFALFKNIGFDDAILRMDTEDHDKFHTLWTIRFIFSAAVSLALYLAAPVMADLLQEDRIEDVLQIMCLMVVLHAFHSPAIQVFRKRMAFGKEMMVRFLEKILSVGSIILFVLYVERSYMGLVYSNLTVASLGVVTSFLFYAYIPKISFTNFKEQLSFSFWTLVRNFSSYGSGAFDEWAAKRSTNSETFGAYHVAHDLARLLVMETIFPIGEAFASAVQRVKNDLDRLRDVVVRFLAVLVLIGLPVATGIVMTSKEIIHILLGSQWDVAIQFLPYLAFAKLALVFSNSLNGIFLALDKQKTNAFLKLFRAGLVVVACLVALLMGEGALIIAQLYMWFMIAFVLGEYIYLFTSLKISLGRLSFIFRPVVAAIAMAYVLHIVPFDDVPMHITFLALSKIAIGSTVYGATLFVLWILSGKPEGAETEILSKVINKH